MNAKYDRIVAALRAVKLYRIEGALDLAIEQEAEALVDKLPLGSARNTRMMRAREQACEFYADEIIAALEAPAIEPLTPDQVLGHRRAPTVWAIVTLMREEGVKP